MTEKPMTLEHAREVLDLHHVVRRVAASALTSIWKQGRRDAAQTEFWRNEFAKLRQKFPAGEVDDVWQTVSRRVVENAQSRLDRIYRITDPAFQGDPGVEPMEEY